MFAGYLRRWVAQWLERHGLGHIADVLDSRAASLGDAVALHDLGRRAMNRGNCTVAISHLERALLLEPRDPTLLCSLGAAYRHEGQLDLARKCYEDALAIKPDYPQVLSNLGEWCIARGELEEAIEWFDKSLVVMPGFFEAKLNKTVALFELSQFVAARQLAEQVVTDEPTRPEAYLNLGNVLVHTGKSKQGIKQYQKALELRPGYAEAHYNLATLLGSRGDLANTIGYLERQIKERGDSIQNLGMLAAAHQAAGHLAESESICQRILARQPDNITALVTLGSCFSSSGDSASALALYEQVVRLDPTQSAMASNVLFEYNNLTSASRDLVFQTHSEWAAKFETPLLPKAPLVDRKRDPNRKLRIGYVSGDFLRHPVGFLLRDILRHHDDSKFHVHCFSMVIRPEEVLPELREAADAWDDVFFLSDNELVELIVKAEIDILIDLSGHTAFHRLLVFARRPAPIQVEWIGYFHSTGMTSIDYFITDPHTTPADSGQLFSEIPVWMPHTRFCYGPPEYAPEVCAPPASSFGKITFGSFNRLPKITDEVVLAWASILAAVPESRLVIKSGAMSEPLVIDRLTARFAARGIAADRLDLREGSSHFEMLGQYGDIDIALDTFPFNGGMTTLEALWMGVPVLTIVGDTVVSRQTVSALANIGLADELAFANLDAFVDGAVSLANNPVRLAELRRDMRAKMEASPLRQSKQFATDLETLYLDMWHAYCQGRRLPACTG